MEDKFIILGDLDISPFLKALRQFNSANKNNDQKSDIEKAGLIKFFELTYELAWKTMKKVLVAKGINDGLNNPRDVFRHSALNALIDDPEVWFSFIKDRNLTVHTYNQETCEIIIHDLDSFGKEVNKFAEYLRGLSA